MDSIESIANLSTALSQAQLRSAVSMRVLKMAQGADQVAADLIAETMDNVAQSMEAFAAEAGTHIDTFA